MFFTLRKILLFSWLLLGNQLSFIFRLYMYKYFDFFQPFSLKGMEVDNSYFDVLSENGKLQINFM